MLASIVTFILAAVNSRKRKSIVHMKWLKAAVPTPKEVAKAERTASSTSLHLFAIGC